MGVFRSRSPMTTLGRLDPQTSRAVENLVVKSFDGVQLSPEVVARKSLTAHFGLYSDSASRSSSDVLFRCCVQASRSILLSRLVLWGNPHPEARPACTSAGLLRSPNRRTERVASSTRVRRPEDVKERSPRDMRSPRKNVGVIKRPKGTRPSGYEKQPRLGGASRWSRTGKKQTTAPTVAPRSIALSPYGRTFCTHSPANHADTPMPNLSKKYREYISGPLWEAQREHAFATWGRLCQACGSSEDVHGHHLSYGQFSDVKAGDVMPLCGACHLIVHGIPELVERLKRCGTSGERRDLIVSRIRSLSATPVSSDRKWIRAQEQLRRENNALISERAKRAELSRTLTPADKWPPQRRRGFHSVRPLATSSLPRSPSP
jgi:hypothetical protein